MNLFQSPEWEKFKLASVYQKSYRIDDILILQKDLPLRLSMLYSPMVDEEKFSRIQNSELKIKQEYLEQINKISRSNNAIFYRS